MSYYFNGNKDKALAYITISYFKNPNDELFGIKKEIAMEIVGDWNK